MVTGEILLPLFSSLIITRQVCCRLADAKIRMGIAGYNNNASVEMETGKVMPLLRYGGGFDGLDYSSRWSREVLIDQRRSWQYFDNNYRPTYLRTRDLASAMCFTPCTDDALPYSWRNFASLESAPGDDASVWKKTFKKQPTLKSLLLA
jgi:hypothetical protein